MAVRHDCHLSASRITKKTLLRLPPPLTERESDRSGLICIDVVRRHAERKLAADFAASRVPVVVASSALRASPVLGIGWLWRLAKERSTDTS